MILRRLLIIRKPLIFETVEENKETTLVFTEWDGVAVYHI